MLDSLVHVSRQVASLKPFPVKEATAQHSLLQDAAILITKTDIQGRFHRHYLAGEQDTKRNVFKWSLLRVALSVITDRNNIKELEGSSICVAPLCPLIQLVQKGTIGTIYQEAVEVTEPYFAAMSTIHQSYTRAR